VSKEKRLQYLATDARRNSHNAFFRKELQLLVTANVSHSPILFSLKMEALLSSEASVITKATGRNIPEYGILLSHRGEDMKFYLALTGSGLSVSLQCVFCEVKAGFYIPEDGILQKDQHRKQIVHVYN
jgi:hypothetical protein